MRCGAGHVKIGELAELTGASVRSLRYYEQQGLIASERTSGGHRTFADNAVGRVQLIRELLAAGLPARSIAVLLQCEDTGQVTGTMIAEVRDRHAEITRRIGELGVARDRLAGILSTLDNAESG